VTHILPNSIDNSSRTIRRLKLRTIYNQGALPTMLDREKLMRKELKEAGLP